MTNTTPITTLFLGQWEYIALSINGVGGGCFLLLPMFQLINENTQWSVCQTSIWASSESKVLWTVRTMFNQAHPSFIQQWSKLDDTETTGFLNHQDTIHFGMLHVTSKRKRLSWVGLQDFVLCKAEGNVGRTQCRELPLCAGSGEGCQWQALPSLV